MISAEEPLKCSDMMGMASHPNHSYFYSTVSMENHMPSLHNRTVILSAVKLSLVPILEVWGVKGSAPPSQVYDGVFEEAGGLLNVCSLSDVPRNRKQVENVKYKGREVRSQDELYDLTLKLKDEEESGKVYIRRLQVAPSPACDLAPDRQVQDVKRFCANTTNQCSILDTFNLQAFAARRQENWEAPSFTRAIQEKTATHSAILEPHKEHTLCGVGP